MARRSPFSTRTSRLALETGDAPAWEVISEGLRFGYRRGRGTQGRGGSWLAATHGPDGRRVQQALGRADDHQEPDGVKVLSCEQAKEAARAWRRNLLARRPAPCALTVNDVVERYLESREAEGMKSIYDARSRVGAHIRPKLGSIAVSDLTVEILVKWRNDMVQAPKMVRTGRFATHRNTKAVDLTDEDALRRRRDTANRTLTTLKSALNWVIVPL